MKLNLSDEPITAELLRETLRRVGTAVIGVNGSSMHPTLQMGWRVHLRPAAGADLKLGQIAVFRGDPHLTIHRLIWKERNDEGLTLVFRGDYNRVRERVDPDTVLARVVAVEVPGQRQGQGRVYALEADILTYFYVLTYGLYTLLRPVLPGTGARGRPPGVFERAVRSVFAATERVVSIFLRQRR